MSTAPPPRGSRLIDALTDVGSVLLVWALGVLAEFVLIGVTCAPLFAGNWELVLARKVVLPIALAMVAPAALLVVGAAYLAAQSIATSERDRPLARGALAALVGSLAALVGAGVSEGRHFESLFLRVPFVVMVASGAGGLAFALAPHVARLFSGPRGAPVALFAGLVLTPLLWIVDVRVLPRLYPAFHTALLGLLLVTSALPALAWRGTGGGARRGEHALALVGWGLAFLALVWAPFAAKRLDRSDNLRILLTEHAPVLGRAVRVAAWLSPPAPLEAADAQAPSPNGEVKRALDWSGRDILLITVDALRADHLGAYGYGRKTTPNLDALAKKAALFEHAYCPTPHTSYSVTSMMTGKAMRPLLSLGLGKQSDTWATYLRRYGYKTAAFYPPAVFYIDQERFTELETSGLGFEYRWVEFTSAEARVKEVSKYLASAGPEPVFLWVHLFEPHEPYVDHPGYAFGGETKLPVDSYDSEVAYADAAIGDLLRIVRASRPNAVVVVTADHGEEFGEHGGRYHGTTCYEEQVRVPLLVSGPGVVAQRIATVVQTIDLLPTVLSALGIPRPARVRGRDLGAVLAHAGQDDAGFAYAETDEQTLVARGSDRLLCQRKLGACALYDVGTDPGERVDEALRAPAKARELRALTAGVERDQGRYEVADVQWPDALRRGLQGDADAAEDVAGLLDDASVVVRRKAAEVTFRLAAREVLPQVARALSRDEDEEVKRWTALALVRAGEPPTTRADALVHDQEQSWRRAASLAFALAGDARGKAELAAYWRDEGPPRLGLDTAAAKELLGALAKIRDVDAVPSLLTSLEYVPLRPSLAETLGAIGDPRARQPLFALFSKERYETARPFEARSLLSLGVGRDLLAPLAVFAGLGDPMREAVTLARDAKILEPAEGGATFEPPLRDVDVELTGPSGSTASQPMRLWVITGPGGEPSLVVGGQKPRARSMGTGVWGFDIEPGPDAAVDARVRIEAHGSVGLEAMWLVARAKETPAFLRPPVPDASAGQ